MSDTTEAGVVATTEDPQSDMLADLCGPSVAYFTLRYFGIENIDVKRINSVLVQEVDGSTTTSFASIKNVIDEQNLNTYALDITPAELGERFDTVYAMVHTAKHESGHYLVYIKKGFSQFLVDASHDNGTIVAVGQERINATLLASGYTNKALVITDKPLDLSPNHAFAAIGSMALFAVLVFLLFPLRRNLYHWFSGRNKRGKRVLNVLAVLFSFLIACGVGAEGQFVVPESIDLGKRSLGSEVKGVVTARNTGNTNIDVISVKASCTCAKPDFGERLVVGPGKSVDIGFTVVATKPTTELALLTNESGGKAYKVAITLDLERRYEATPSSMRFSKYPKEQWKGSMLEIGGDDVTKADIVNEDGHLTYSIVEGGDAKKLRLLVQPKDDVSKSTRSSLRISLNDREKSTLDVPIEVQVLNDVQLIPAAKVVTLASNSGEVAFAFKVKGESAVTIEKVETELPASTFTFDTTSASTVTVNGTLDTAPYLGKDIVSGYVYVKVAERDEPLAFRVTLVAGQ